MNWLGLILASMVLLTRLTEMWVRKQAIDDAKAAVALDHLRRATDALRKVRTARQLAAARDSDPERLRDDDGHRRD